MRFIRVIQNEQLEYQVNLEKLLLVQLTATHGYLQLADQADRIMISLAEWQRIGPLLPPTEFIQVRETETKCFVVNLNCVSHIQVTTSFCYLYVHGIKERLMLKPDVWAEISIHFPAQ
ncbi:MAG: hypothetical protein SFY92_11335 [Verrucomicrobiae bacterium]|nr:hypothetical protein [Verrucomicrobiae bacterium]